MKNKRDNKSLIFLRSSTVSFNGQTIDVNVYSEKGTGLLYITDEEGNPISLGGRMGKEL